MSYLYLIPLPLYTFDSVLTAIPVLCAQSATSFSQCLFKPCLFSHSTYVINRAEHVIRWAFSNKGGSSPFLPPLSNACSTFQINQKVTSSRDFVNVTFVCNLPATFSCMMWVQMVPCSFQMESQPINNNKQANSNNKSDYILSSSPTIFSCEMPIRKWDGGPFCALLGCKMGFTNKTSLDTKL